MNDHQTEPASFIKIKDPKEKTAKPYISNPFTLAFEAFGRFFETNKNWALFLIILGALNFLTQGVGSVSDMIASRSAGSTPNSPASTLTANNPDIMTIVALIVGITSIVLFFLIISTIIATYLQGVFAYVALQSEKGETVTLSEAHEQTSKRFWRLLKASVLAGLKIFAWSLLLIIPGIIAAFRYKLLPYTIMSQSADETGLTNTHTTTKKITKGRLLEVFGVGFASGIIPLIGGILGLAGYAALFNQLSDADKNDTKKPPIHWLNKLLLALAIVMILLLLAAAVIFVVYVVDYI